MSSRQSGSLQPMAGRPGCKIACREAVQRQTMCMHGVAGMLEGLAAGFVHHMQLCGVKLGNSRRYHGVGAGLQDRSCCHTQCLPFGWSRAPPILIDVGAPQGHVGACIMFRCIIPRKCGYVASSPGNVGRCIMPRCAWLQPCTCAWLHVCLPIVVVSGSNLGRLSNSLA